MIKGVRGKIIIFYLILSSLYAQPRIQFESKEIEFGEMGQNKSKVKTVFFRNVGNDELEIIKIRSSCNCTVGKLDIEDRKVPPGSTGKIEVTFNSHLYRGSVSKSIFIETNDPEDSAVILKIKATVKGSPLPPPIRICFFYSDDCKECVFVKEKILNPLRKRYDLRVRWFDVSDSSNYKYLLSIGKKYNDSNNDIPIIVIGKYILGGIDEIKKSLKAKTIEYEDSGCDFPDLSTTDIPPLGSFERVESAYFYDNKCKVCERTNFEVIFLEKDYPNLTIAKYDISGMEDAKTNEAFCEFFNVPQNKRLTSPMFFIGKDYLIGEDFKKANLSKFADKYVNDGARIPWWEISELRERAEENIQKRFENISAFNILLAGLIDGLNPCMFAAIIFLIAFLSILGKKEGKTLLIGITYSAVIFILYFLISLGLIKFVGILKITNIIGKTILGFMALLAIIVGILSFYDYIGIKRDEMGKVKLKLPMSIKKRIHSVIREKMGRRNVLIATIISCLFISLSEFIWDGQIYLPTLIFVSGVPGLRIKALAYLIFYNIAFIIPLVIVFLATYKGLRSSTINKLWRNKVKFVKLMTSFFFVLLGIFIILYIFFY